MRGLRKVQRNKPLRSRGGLDDPAHLARVRQMACLLRGKQCTVTRWRGVYPELKESTWQYLHVCGGWPIDPHHTEKKSHRGHDRSVVPLCRMAHEDAERLGNDGFLARWGVDLAAEARRLSETPHPAPPD